MSYDNELPGMWEETDLTVGPEAEVCECGRIAGTFACKIRHVAFDTSWAKGDH